MSINKCLTTTGDEFSPVSPAHSPRLCVRGAKSSPTCLVYRPGRSRLPSRVLVLAKTVASARFPGLLAHRTERQEKRERGISEKNFPLRAFSPRRRPRDGSIHSPISLPLPIHCLMHGATPPYSSPP